MVQCWGWRRAAARETASSPCAVLVAESSAEERVLRAQLGELLAVNAELQELSVALPMLVARLATDGRLAVISFHSLEDRLVKRFMRDLERGCECPPDFPICVCGKQPELRSTSRKAIRPSARETAANPRSSSARLRVGIKS